jgi:hypothetical protein
VSVARVRMRRVGCQLSTRTNALMPQRNTVTIMLAIPKHRCCGLFIGYMWVVGEALLRVVAAMLWQSMC